MRTLSHHDVLGLWERAQPLDVIGRAVALVPVVDDAGALPLGARDAHLLALVVELGESRLDVVTACPACGEQVEASLGADELIATAASGTPDRTVRVAGHSVEFRCPDSRDLAAAGATGDAARAHATLLDRCVVRAVGPEGAVAPSTLPDAVCAAVGGAMSAADPLAEVLVDLACPACGSEYAADVDVASLAWRTVQRHARRLLADVDALGRAYGWSEEQVLALTDSRRAAYVQLATEGKW